MSVFLDIVFPLNPNPSPSVRRERLFFNYKNFYLFVPFSPWEKGQD